MWLRERRMTWWSIYGSEEVVSLAIFFKAMADKAEEAKVGTSGLLEVLSPVQRTSSSRVATFVAEGMRGNELWCVDDHAY